MDMRGAMSRWASATNTQITQQKQTDLNKSTSSIPATNRKTGKHALKSYLAVVQFPPSKGGGVVWLKNRASINRYEDMNYKVMWL